MRFFVILFLAARWNSRAPLRKAQGPEEVAQEPALRLLRQAQQPQESGGRFL